MLLKTFFARWSSIAWRVCSVLSKRTGLPNGGSINGITMGCHVSDP